MNDYISLDGKQYKCRFPDWVPWFIKPGTIRYTLGGNSDVTYGTAVPQGWQGFIEVPYTGSSPWGGRTDFETSVKKLQAISFTDHFGSTYNVNIVGEITFEAMKPMYDDTTSKLYYGVRLEKA